MLAVTDDAKVLLKEVLEQRGQPDQVLRLSRTAGGFELTLDRASDDDVTYDVDGRDVLAVQRELADELRGITVELQEAAGGPRLVFAT